MEQKNPNAPPDAETSAAKAAARPAVPYAPKRDRRRWFLLGGAAGVLVLAALVHELLFAFAHESTDDAFIDAHVGTIAARVAGQAARVLVDDNQLVVRGEALVEIDPRDFEVKLDQARAQLLAAQAAALRAGLDLKRYQRLLRTDDASRQQLDAAKADADSARANVLSQQAAVRQAELDLSYARVTAPESGRVTHKAVEVGDYLKVGQPILAIVPTLVWVTANFKETQLTRMKAGQTVTIKVDAYPGRVFRGRVDSIQSGTGAQFSLLPPENATGNYVKVVERIPVKILIDAADAAAAPLAPGMSVVPTVEVK
jgi:membrane fusion protein (multidrug efflux system)